MQIFLQNSCIFKKKIVNLQSTFAVDEKNTLSKSLYQHEKSSIIFSHALFEHDDVGSKQDLVLLPQFELVGR